MAYVNAHAALIEDGIVRNVIVIPRQEDDRDDLVQAYCNSIGLAGVWVDTSYTGSRRGKYAGLGDSWDGENFSSPTATEAVTEL
jgi:hypothetical protein